MQHLFKPKCFPDVKTFREWVALAMVAKEVVSPCDDCTASYESKMREVELCQKFRIVNDLTIGSRAKVLTKGIFQ
jgi:hypothetical protein